MTKSPEIIRSIEDLHVKVYESLSAAQTGIEEHAAAEGSSSRRASLGYVATMGALHEGHATLMRRAREQNDVVVISIFVNPLQFGPHEDFEKYPRTLEADTVLAAQTGVDFIFAPDIEQVYPDGKPRISVSSGQLGTMFEGRARPGHFDGALTVINKFFNILKPAVAEYIFNAYFGQKDAQQLSLVQRMVADFSHRVTIKPVAVVREDNGLALSSRNRFLSDTERESALVLSRTLALLREQLLAQGSQDIDLRAARERIDSTEGVRLDYLEVVDPVTFEEPTAESRQILALVAAYVGETRLIDNMELL